MTAIDLLRMMIRAAKQFIGLAEQTLKKAEAKEARNKK